MMRATLALVVAVAGLLSGCTYENAEDLAGQTPAPACDNTAVTYSATIAPILQQHCLNCHSAALRNGNVILETHAQVRSYAASGLLVGVVSHAPGFDPMPKAGPMLSDCDIAKIRIWAQQGAPNN